MRRLIPRVLPDGQEVVAVAGDARPSARCVVAGGGGDGERLAAGGDVLRGGGERQQRQERTQKERDKGGVAMDEAVSFTAPPHLQLYFASVDPIVGRRVWVELLTGRAGSATLTHARAGVPMSDHARMTPDARAPVAGRRAHGAARLGLIRPGPRAHGEGRCAGCSRTTRGAMPDARRDGAGPLADRSGTTRTSLGTTLGSPRTQSAGHGRRQNWQRTHDTTRDDGGIHRDAIHAAADTRNMTADAFFSRQYPNGNSRQTAFRRH